MSGPLAGRTVLLTRAGGLEEEVRALGAEVRVVPVTRYEPVAATVDPESFDRVVFTSARAAAHCPFLLASLSQGGGPRIACIGPQTTELVREAGETVVERDGLHAGVYPRGCSSAIYVSWLRLVQL